MGMDYFWQRYFNPYQRNPINRVWSNCRNWNGRIGLLIEKKGLSE